MEQNIFFSINYFETIGYPNAKKKRKKKNLDTDLISFPRINSICIIDLNEKL